MYVTNVYANGDVPTPYCFLDNGCILNLCGGDGCALQLF